MAQPNIADKMLTFPDSRQCTPDMCGVSAAQAILYYYGQSIIQSKLSVMMGLDPEVGVEPENIIKLFEDKDFEVDFRKMTVEDVKDYLDRDTPVILLIQAWAADYPVDYSDMAEEGHYVVAVGYDDTQFFFDDPSFLENKGFIPYDELMTRWRMYASDGENILENYGIAIYGPKPLFNPRLVMHIDGSLRPGPAGASGRGFRASGGFPAPARPALRHRAKERLLTILRPTSPATRVAYNWLVRRR